MKKRLNPSHLSTTELLRTRICDLELSLEDSPFYKNILQVQNELKKKKLNFHPHFWGSDEWFCPDGVKGIAIPFTLFHPKLIKLEKKYLGSLEGSTEKQFLKILRHECGHAFENAYKLKKNKERIQLFGDSKVPYPDKYIPQRYSKNYVLHLSQNYAQAHPDEDFAETFAEYLTHTKSRNNKKYANTLALVKLKLMEKLVTESTKTPPLLSSQRVISPYYLDKRTVKEYLQAKQKQLMKQQIFTPTFVNAPLKKDGARFVTQILKSHQKEIIARLAQKKMASKYHLKTIVQASIKEARLKQLRTSKPETVFINLFSQKTTKALPVLLKRKKHAIIM